MISVSRRDHLVIPLIILFVCEACAVTNYRYSHFSQLGATLIFFFAGILISVLPFIINIHDHTSQASSAKTNLIIARAVFGIFFLSLVLFVVRNTQINLAAN